MRFEGKIVKKPWGCEYLAFDDGNVAVWYLHIRSGERTSQHYHEKKDTVLVTLSGQTSRVPQVDFIRRGEAHSTLALTDAWVMEIEAPSDKLDLVRLGDDYGREGKPYENGENIIPFDPRYAYPSKEFP